MSRKRVRFADIGFFPRVEAKGKDRPWHNSDREELLNFLLFEGSTHPTIYERYARAHERSAKAVKRQLECFLHWDINNTLDKYEPTQLRGWRRKFPINAMDRYVVETAWDSYKENEKPFPLADIAHKLLRRDTDEVLHILYTKRVPMRVEWEAEIAHLCPLALPFLNARSVSTRNV